MQLNIPDLLALFFSGAGVCLCLAVGVLLLNRKKGVRQTNVLLGLLLVLNSITLLNSLMAMIGLYSKYQYLYFLPLVFSLSIGPLYYFFIKSRIDPTFRLSKKHRVHFIIPFAQFVFYCIIGFRSAEYKSMIWQTVVQPYSQYIEEGLFIILGFGYLIASYQLLKKEVAPVFWKQPVYTWLKRFTIALAFLFSISIFYEVLDWILWGFYEYNLFNTAWLDFPLKMSYAGISLLIGYNAYLYQNQELITKKAFDHQESDLLATGIKDLMEEKKVFLDPELNLETFAKMLDVPKNKLSKYLTEQNESFRGMLNRYRIKTFMEQVENGRHKQLTLLAIAYDAGFNSKASFNRVFKEYTGQTPSEYLKMSA